MIEAVHPCGRDRPVGLYAVPAFPHRCRAQFDLIKPSGVFLVQQKAVRQLMQSVFGQHIAEQRRTHETGLQFPACGFELVCKPLFRKFNIGEVMPQR
jgi:hypothetical protein